MTRALASTLALFGWIIAVPLLAQQPGAGRGNQPPFVRQIEQVRGDLQGERPRVGAVTVFLVTQDGIILTDTLNPEFAAWLKGELAGFWASP
jgi:hypothetical protein